MRAIQVETITTHDGSKIEVIRDVDAVRRITSIAEKALRSIREYPCGHKPWCESGKCQACEALHEWDALASVGGTGEAAIGYH